MIGRAAIANPWIFAGLDREQVSSELLHQIFLRMQSARSIEDEKIDVSSGGGLAGIVRNCGGVASHLVLDDLNTDAVRPD